MKSGIQILLFVMFFIVTGCVTLYKPNVIHSPLLEEKGQFNSSASLGISGSGLFNLQGAYAITNHTGVMIDGMYHKRNLDSVESSVEKLTMFFGEAGAGYFTAFGNKKKGLFQCYSGGGYGITSDKIEKVKHPPPKVNAKYYNIFIQPGVGIINKNYAIAFDLRINYVNLYKVHANLYNKFEWWNTDYHYYSDTSLYFINLEPTFTLKAGKEKLKGVLQLGLTIPTINSHSYFVVNTSSMLGIPLIKFSVGINYTFGM